MQLLDGSFPPQIKIFYPKKTLFAPDFAFFHPKCLPRELRIAAAAPKGTPRTRAGPGGSVGIFWHGFFLLGMVLVFFPRMGFEEQGKQEQREGRELLKPILQRMDDGGCSSLIFDGADWNLSGYVRDREEPVLGISIWIQRVSSIPEKPRGRTSSTPWEHKVAIQPAQNGKVPPSKLKKKK